MRILFASLLVLLSVAARADLYQWTDASGHVHFSDKPESGQKAKVIKTTVQPPETSAGVPHAAGESAHDIAERQKQALKNLDDARKKRAEAQAKADAKAKEDADKCRAARSSNQFMSQGGRMFTYDENGDRHYYSDDEIAQKKAAVQQAVQDACD